MLKKVPALKAAFVFCAAASFCLGQGAPQATPGFSATTEKRQAPAVQATASSYRIGVGDVVSISVYQEDDLTTTARVGDGGQIVFPLLGTVRLSGLTVAEATREITAQLLDGYLVNPIVSVSLMEQTKTKFTILGQVLRPGPYDLPANGSTSLMEAVGMAGGFTRIASASRITIKRGTETLKVNGKDQSSAAGKAAVRILPGDIITIPESLF
jgi:protein involved in polysaccharide export with SLBB domain